MWIGSGYNLRIDSCITLAYGYKLLNFRAHFLLKLEKNNH
jgi:hypothetical protein